MLTQEDIQVLSKPFPDDTVGVKVQSISKAKNKAMLILYLQHTDVYARLEEVDAGWVFKTVSCEKETRTDWKGTYTVTVVRAQLTVCGVTRENAGEGDDPKSAYSDALKRCAMLFGVGRYLYDAELVWVDYSEERDKFRTWTMADYKASSRKPMQTATNALPSAPQKASGALKKPGDLTNTRAAEVSAKVGAILAKPLPPAVGQSISAVKRLGNPIPSEAGDLPFSEFDER